MKKFFLNMSGSDLILLGVFILWCFTLIIVLIFDSDTLPPPQEAPLHREQAIFKLDNKKVFVNSCKYENEWVCDVTIPFPNEYKNYKVYPSELEKISEK